MRKKAKRKIFINEASFERKLEVPLLMFIDDHHRLVIPEWHLVFPEDVEIVVSSEARDQLEQKPSRFMHPIPSKSVTQT